MKFTLDQLQRDVMARLGEIPRPLSLHESEDIPSACEVMRNVISSLLPCEGTKLIKEANQEMLGGGEEWAGIVEKRLMPCGLYAAEVGLPESFLRLVSAKLSCWRRSVCRLISPGDPEWPRQWSSEPGIAGNPDRPRVYLDGDGDCLKLRMSGSEDPDYEIDRVCICAIPAVGEDGGFMFPPSLYVDLVDKISGKIIALSSD
ncbi:MAG: hypothetical protein K2G85_08695 [Muribaculaceae bacterium]|nr:hypothetical protein [Muribaculaceae bacterium]